MSSGVVLKKPVLPGQTVGILGGGQLGRMFAIAARRMGYRVHSFDPTNDCPAGQVADVEVNAAYDDVEAALHFANHVDVVTFEFENIPAETLEAVAKFRPVYPDPNVLHTCRHRLREKQFLQANGFPLADFRPVENVNQLHQAVIELGSPAVLKTADFGYDGKGQQRIHSPDDVADAWANLGRPVGVLERFVPFEKEISVVCARSLAGEIVCFPPAENEHRNHILDVTTVPSQLSQDQQTQAVELARDITNNLNVVGVLAVEMFVLPDCNILVNELAPRPHNSGHFSFDASLTSQFEQQLRAVCGLPLGDVTLLRPVAMANLLGELWQNGEPNWKAALEIPQVKLHLYGKREPRPGRKMGHLTALAESANEARASVLAARDRLTF